MSFNPPPLSTRWFGSGSGRRKGSSHDTARYASSEEQFHNKMTFDGLSASYRRKQQQCPLKHLYPWISIIYGRLSTAWGIAKRNKIPPGLPFTEEQIDWMKAQIYKLELDHLSNMFSQLESKIPSYWLVGRSNAYSTRTDEVLVFFNDHITTLKTLRNGHIKWSDVLDNNSRLIGHELSVSFVLEPNSKVDLPLGPFCVEIRTGKNENQNPVVKHVPPFGTEEPDKVYWDTVFNSAKVYQFHQNDGTSGGLHCVTKLILCYGTEACSD